MLACCCSVRPGGATSDDSATTDLLWDPGGRPSGTRYCSCLILLSPESLSLRGKYRRIECTATTRPEPCRTKGTARVIRIPLRGHFDAIATVCEAESPVRASLSRSITEGQAEAVQEAESTVVP